MQPVVDDFKDLRRLLALKRHEQPPPGFQDHFARQVAARIYDLEHSLDDALFENVLTRVPWLRRLWSSLETRPLCAGAFGTAVCLFLFSGLAYSYRIEPAQIGSTAIAVPLDGSQDQAPVSVANAPVSDRPLFLQINETERGAALFLPRQRTLLFRPSTNSSDSWQPHYY